MLKYVWNVLHQGLRDSSDQFLGIKDDMLRRGNLKNYVKCFDDILLFAKDLKILAHTFQQLLEIWMTLQPKKLRLSSPDTEPMKYSGMKVSYEGITPDNGKVNTISDLRVPKDFPRDGRPAEKILSKYQL